MYQRHLIADLPQAHASLQNYIEEKNSCFYEITPELQASVCLLSNQLKTLFAQQGWLRQGGLIADYYAQKRVQKISQSALINEAFTHDIKTRKFTILILQRTIKDIVALLRQPSLPLHLENLLKKIHRYIINTLLQAKTQGNLSLLFKLPIPYLARVLNIAYIPSAQFLDPISETLNPGHCYGHVKIWHMNILSSQKQPPLPVLFRVTPESYYHQNFQPRGHLERIAFFSKSETLRCAVQNIISAVSTQYIYEFNFPTVEKIHQPLVYHSTGIRKFSDGKYELFDSNWGLFVFENEFQLEKFLVVLLRDYLENNIGKQEDSLKLFRLSFHDPHCSPSIPELTFDFSGKYKYVADKETELTLNARRLLMHENISQAEEKSCKVRQSKMYHYFFKQQKSWGLREKERIHAAIDKESEHLKEVVIEKITDEIKRLENKWFGFLNDKQIRINGQRQLRNNVNKAGPMQTLSVIINQWLESKPAGSVRTNRKIISCRYTRQFVNELEEHYEISPYYLNFIRACLVERLRHMIFERDWSFFYKEGYKKIPYTIELMREVFNYFEHGELTLRNFLVEIVRKARKSCADFLIKKSDLSDENIYLFNLYKCLSEIRPDDDDWINNCFSSIKEFDERFLKEIISCDSEPVAGLRM